jgi:succinyl-CoA synthetase beta subunit
VARSLDNTNGLVVKAQVQAGGRGKGHLTSGMKGGVHVVKTPETIAEKTLGMIGYNLITH